MESNFKFLEPKYPEYYKLAAEAEKNVFSAPRTAVIYARLTLEELIKWMYIFDENLSCVHLEKPTLEALMYHNEFKKVLNGSIDILNGMTLIRKNGNQAVHTKTEISLRYAHISIQNLFEFCKWFYFTYVDSAEKLPFSFNSDLIPRGDGSNETIATVKALQANLDKVIVNTEKTLQHKEEVLEQLRAEIARIKIENQTKITPPFTLNPSTEAETRKVLIDVMLRETGWNVEEPGFSEYKVTGMPNKTGVGYVDYVLWGNDGLPLAIVEAKNTLHDSQKGQQQAKLYADCLENKFGRRPVIFYSNGYKSWIWDDILYPPRPVSGFYTKDELEWTISKRNKKSLLDAIINKDIAGRPYQERAIKRVSEAFEAKHRKALLVMATGTGKTRTAIALVDIMLRQGWARRILFLADRNALVIQAKGNFVKLLPSLSCVNITKEKENLHRMVFSTYPTMMNKIDLEKIDDLLFYTPAHFDMIIIDEAHRSIYQKYQSIFRYFDALLVGLTATPKSEVDKNTYELFDLETHNPTDFYELDQAVTDGWLVAPKKNEVATKFLRDGIKYKDLSEEDKERYEEDFTDELSGDMPEEVEASKLNDFVFNSNTVDLVLNKLMEDGIKIEGGDKIGKTIIFAKNHKHALYIAERFDILYPHLKGGFLRVIDNKIDYAQSLIEDFGEPKKQPQIAVSVDMLDTGIDVPEILNLVFFKVVRSSSKFWQMIGRGTRLRPGIFGIPENEDDKSKDKKEFLIFDYCQNFEFFDVNPDGFESKMPKSVSQRIMECQITLSQTLDFSIDEAYSELRKSLLDAIHNNIINYNRNSFVVKEALDIVDKYSIRERWDNVSRNDMAEIFDKITPLAIPMDTDENARNFDLFMLQFMQAKAEENPSLYKYTSSIKNIGLSLLKKTNLPIVKCKDEILRKISNDNFWQNECTIISLEQIRIELRDLIRLIEKEKRKIIYTNLEDEISVSIISDVIPIYVASDNYKQRVEKYVRDNENHLAIQKLKKNIPITPAELQILENLLFDGNERGTKTDFIKAFGKKPLGWFIRSIVGLDVNAAKSAFGDFLSAGNLSADQIHFIDMIIDYITRNGVIDAEMLYEPPFTDFHTQGISGIFDDDGAMKLISIIKQINLNAVA